jgi:hypothetical protein
MLPRLAVRRPLPVVAVPLLGLALLAGGRSPTTSGAFDDDLVFRGPGPTSIRSEAPPCSDVGFDVVENCINADLPPSPSIRRRFVAPRNGVSQDPADLDLALTKPFSARSHAGAFAQTFALPNHRTSVDGRLTTVDGNRLARFSPENLAPGFRTFADPGRRVLSHSRLLVHELRTDPRPGRSRVPQHVITRDDFGTGVFWEMCNGTAPDGTGQMRLCRARRTPQQGLEEGECYDVTILWANHGPADGEMWWELRSIDLTVFIPRGKSVPTSGQPHWEDGYIYYYPRSEVDGLTELPPLSDFEPPSGFPPVVSHQALVQVANEACTGPDQPKWCRYLDEQRSLVGESFRFYTGPDTYHHWDGRLGSPAGPQGFHALLEPATTADGRVLFIHDYGQGIMYSYNTEGACDARGFRDFKPISQAYLDPDVNSRYGFARYPIRDTSGVAFPPGATVVGAYPWVDRKGSNLMFPVADGQDGFVGRWVANPGQAGWAPDGQEVQPAHVNKNNSTGVVVVGAWTRGKMVVLDNGLNATDWTFSADAFRAHRFRLPLYGLGRAPSEQVLVRPSGVALLNSLENSLNQYDAMSPISPFDVVWTASSTQARNAEVVFDEYLRRGMRVVAHMNAPMTRYPTGRAEFPFLVTYDNGFVPTAVVPNAAGFVFRRTPRLQNASTMPSPATLELRGGAWIPPVAEGGVLGRGVYLDGVNDHILVQRLPGRLSHFYLGLWIDQQKPSPTLSRTLYRFGDGTRVTLRRGGVSVVAPGGATASAELSPERTGHRRYFHLGLAFGWDGQQTHVRVWEDGTYVGTHALPRRVEFSLAPPVAPVQVDCPRATGWRCAPDGLGAGLCHGGQVMTTTSCAYNHMVCSQASIDAGGPACVPTADGQLVVGNSRPDGGAPIRAWVDELRLIDLQPAEASSRVFAELACNLALGSLAFPGQVGSQCEQIPLRHDEPEDEEGVGTGLDFPVEAYTQRNCGNTVHRNAVEPCGHDEAYGVADKQPVAALPRPDFSGQAFCRTCHVSSTDPVPGLRLGSLVAGTVPSEDDPRRQPMTFFRNMPGGAPHMNGVALPPFGDGWETGDRVLDRVIHGEGPTVRPNRAGPY